MGELDDGKRQTGARIRLLRTKRGLTQRELADAAGVGESTIRGYELGLRYPKEGHLEAMARALRVRPEALQSQAVLTPLDLVHVLFRYEGAYGLSPSDGAVAVGPDGHPGLREALSDWAEKRRLLDAGEITREEYLEWQDAYGGPGDEGAGRASVAD